jgi:hypothetical protein
LLPIFVDAPGRVLPDPKHQFVVFASDERVTKIVRFLKHLRDRLKLDPALYVIAPVKAKGESGETMIANEGSIAGHDWRNYNTQQHIRLSVPRPSTGDDANYFFCLVLFGSLFSLARVCRNRPGFLILISIGAWGGTAFLMWRHI